MARKNRQSGMTLVEMVVTMAVTTTLLLIVYALIDDAVKATMFGESHNDLTIMSQRAVNELRNEILQTRLAYQEDAVGQAYRTAIQLPAAVKPWPDTLLPVFEASPSLGGDSGAGTDRKAGNSLLIARQMPPLSIMWDHDGRSATPDEEMLVDRYRFQYYFLATEKARNFGGSGYYADLIQCRSAEYADYIQLASLSAAEKMRAVPKVQAAGITRSWEPGRALDAAFRELAPAASAGVFAAAISKPKIPVARTASLLRELKGGRISGAMEYSVGFIPKAPKQAFPIRSSLFFYATPDKDRPQFPGGFEVKVVGPEGNRKVGIRLVMMSQYRASTYESQEATLVAAAQF